MHPVWGQRSNEGQPEVGFTRCNLRGCRVASNVLVYTSLVSAGLDYAAFIWDNHTAKDITKLETLCRRSAKTRKQHLKKIVYILHKALS